MTVRAFARRLLVCGCGAMAVETAIVAPVLALMSVGTFEIGTMVSRQQELQSAASEAEAIVMAAAASGGVESDDIKDVIVRSMGLDPEQIDLERRFRCGDGELILDATECEERVTEYVLVHLEDSYTPIWANYGVGSEFDYVVERTIMVK
jgi:hypothetical protein